MDTGIVGRERELAQIDAFLTEDSPRALLLQGAAGIGKTTLWRAGVERARAGPYRVLACRPSEAEAGLAFAGLSDLLVGVDQPLGLLPTPQRRALAVALLLEEAQAPPDPRALAAGFLGVLRVQAAEAPLLIAVDDIQWLDGPTSAALEFAVRRLGGEPIGLLLAHRLEHGGEIPLGLERAFAGAGLEQVSIEPLSLGALGHLVRVHFGLALTRPLLRRVHEVSGGNPFYALEIARALQHHEHELDPSDPLPLSKDLDELVQGRLVKLSADTRRLVLAAAALHEPTFSLLERAVDGSIEPLVLEAQTAHVLEHDGGSITFTHPLLAATAYAAARSPERRALHHRLASLVGNAEERARHLALSVDEPDESVAQALEDATLEAVLRGAPTAAAELAQLASKLTPAEKSSAMTRRLQAAADFFFIAGDIGRARALVQELLPRLAPGHERAGAIVRLSWAHDNWNECRRLCEQAITEAEGDHVLLARACWTLGFSLFALNDLRGGLAQARMAVEFAEMGDDQLLLAQCLATVALVETMAGCALETNALSRALELERDLASRFVTFSPTYPPTLVKAHRLMHGGRFDQARAGFEAVSRHVREIGDEYIEAVVLLHWTELECWAGRWRRAAELAGRGLDLAEALRLGSRIGPVLYSNALVAAHQGRVDDARAAAERARDLSLQDGNAFIRTLSEATLGFVELSVGDLEAADGWLRPLRGRVASSGFGKPSIYRGLADGIEVLVGLGELELAREGLPVLEQSADGPEYGWERAVALRSRGLIAAADGDLEEALAALGRTLAEHASLPMPFERARSLLAMGQVQRRAKHRGEARQALSQALALFEELGAPLWAAKARTDLARVGGRAPAGDVLTVTERHVAELVAAGRSNKAVAAALFVTVKAVEANLSRIYAKLGIHSRTELAHLLSGGELPSKT